MGSDPLTPVDPASGSFGTRRTTTGVLLCNGCLEAGSCRLGLSTERFRSGELELQVVCPTSQMGGPGVAHGGWTAAVMDEALGHVPGWHGGLVVTGQLTVNYRKPVPVERPLAVTARLDRREGRRWYMSGQLRLTSSGAELATAAGIWVSIDPSHFDRQRTWQAEQDAVVVANPGDS